MSRTTRSGEFNEKRRPGGSVTVTATDFDVIVAGAGYAGITAARDMSDRGLSVLVLEASERVGGRAFSSVFSGRDERIEHGAQ